MANGDNNEWGKQRIRLVANSLLCPGQTTATVENNEQDASDMYRSPLDALLGQAGARHSGRR
jgi:hypothetical protein